MLFASGSQVAGPFEPTTRAQLDVVVEQGTAVSYRAVCAADAQSALDSAIANRLASPTRGIDAMTVPAGARASVPISPPPCRWALVTAAIGPPTTAAILLRATGSALSVATTGAAWVKLTLMHFRFNARNADGKPWDVGGGAPDPAIWIATDRGLDYFVSKIQDTFEAQPMAVAPIVEVSATRPLRIGATDMDLAVDDKMGEAEITFDQLQRGPTLSVNFRMSGVTTGTADVRVEFVPRP